MADKQAGFEINGGVYEVPTLDSIDMDEAQILYDLSAIVIEDFAPLHPDSSEEEKALHEVQNLMRIRNPAFKRALAHVAYRRANYDATRDQIELIVGRLRALDVTIAVLRGDEDPPQSSPSEPESKRSGSETSPSTASGIPSGSDSDPQAVILGPIGTGKSDTSSPESALTTSAS